MRNVREQAAAASRVVPAASPELERDVIAMPPTDLH